MRPESVSAIDKLLDTVNSIKSELDSLKDITDITALSRLEDRIRQECQVIEALPGYMGQDIYRQVQARRLEIREQQIAQIRGVTEVKNGSIGTNGNLGNGYRSDESRRVEPEGNSKTSRPARQSKPKKQS